jgi:hypothetical protein
MTAPTAISAEVRAVLGVSETELPDSVIALGHYDLQVVLDLEQVNEGIPDLYTTVSALPTISRTATQQRFYDLVHLFCTYSRAKDLLAALPMFSVQRLSDGRAEFSRQTDSYVDVSAGVQGMYERLRIKLTGLYTTLVTADAPYADITFDYAASVGLAVNPVTGA